MLVFNDFDTTVRRALTEIDKNWESYLGIIICGTHSPQNPEDLIEVIAQAHADGTPFLGICFGHQLAAIEYARNILGIERATSEEFGEGVFVVRKRKEGLKVGLHQGESYWHNYEVDPSIEKLWQKPAHFFTAQFHPEYQSREGKPHPLLVEFIKYAKYVKDYDVAMQNRA